MALQILKSCANSFEAEVIKGLLDSEDIPCMLQGSNISFIRSGLGSQSAFPVNVLVDEENFERATLLLEPSDEEGK